MILTEIDAFYNTPFTDFQNTIHFANNDERDEFFNGRYNMLHFEEPFNMVKDRLVLNTKLSTIETYGLNYLRFRNQFDGNKWYYCFVTASSYINNGVTQLGLVVDTVMTFLQGDFTPYLNNVEVMRQSLNNAKFDYYRDWLMTNNDTLKFPKRYTAQRIEKWKDFFVIFTTSVDLTSDFGTSDNPTLTTSEGQTYDGIVSPVDLYCMKSQSNFTTLMHNLKNYPWIAQNINNVAVVPADIVDEGDLKLITNAKNAGVNAAHVYKFKQNGRTKTVHLDDLSFKEDELPELFGFDDGVPEYATREEYTNIELTGWNGQRVSLAPVFLPRGKGMSMVAQAVFGYHNEIRVFPDQYQSSESENSIQGLYRGTYANKAIIFDVFDDIPVLVDNYKLAKANTAHQRQLGNDRTIGGRWREATNPNNNINDRFFNAMELTTGILGGGLSPLNVAKNALGQFTDEYEHYRDLNAQLADMAISAPSVDSQNNSQSFNMSAGIFGVTAKFSSIGEENMRQVERYHGTFGFDFQGQIVPVESIDSLPLENFLKVSGNFTIPNVPAQFAQQLKVTLENGVKFWHNPNKLDNPFTQDLTYNREIE